MVPNTWIHMFTHTHVHSGSHPDLARQACCGSRISLALSFSPPSQGF